MMSKELNSYMEKKERIDSFWETYKEWKVLSDFWGCNDLSTKSDIEKEGWVQYCYSVDVMKPLGIFEYPSYQEKNIGTWVDLILDKIEKVEVERKYFKSEIQSLEKRLEEKKQKLRESNTKLGMLNYEIEKIKKYG
jgi:hypothetical protein